MSETFEAQLPNLTQLRCEGVFRKYTSTFPPTFNSSLGFYLYRTASSRSWLVGFIDYEEIHRGASAFDVTKLAGNTFWDAAGEQGKRVCVVNPFLAYPVWPVNGVMVNGPVFISGEAQTFPREFGRPVSSALN